MKLLRIVIAAICMLAFAVPAYAQAPTTLTFTTSQGEFTPGVRNQGWWADRISNNEPNPNYFAGRNGDATLRNFFTFNLSSACLATSVTLEVTRFDQQAGELTYSLFDVSTPATDLNRTEGFDQAIFGDLGTGTRFGSFVVVRMGGAVLQFPLNAAGVTAFNAARGGYFSLGGSVTPAGTGDPNLFLFGNSSVGGTQQLVVTCARESAIVGKTTIGAAFAALDHNDKYASPFGFFSSTPATVSKLRAYLDGKGRTTGSQILRGLIYRNTPNGPGALVAQSSPVRIAAGRAPGFVDFPFPSPPTLPGAVYWLGLHAGDSDRVARYAYDEKPGGQRRNDDAFSNGPLDPFGGSDRSRRELSIHAVGR